MAHVACEQREHVSAGKVSREVEGISGKSWWENRKIEAPAKGEILRGGTFPSLPYRGYV